MKISGTFEVKLDPLKLSLEEKDNMQLARLSIAKQFMGSLSGESRGEMISARTPTQGSAGYVAIEHVSGSLEGKQGSFVLQHFALMDKGKPRQIIEVVPDSGTGALSGISGEMQIEIKDGQHYYHFEYNL